MIPNPTDFDVQTLAQTIYGEARNQPYDAQLGIGYVVVNRAKIAATEGRRQFGNGTLSSACLASDQFDCWNPADPNRHIIRMANLDIPAFRVSYLAALSAITGHEPDPTSGATGYWDDSIPTPEWGADKEIVKRGAINFVSGV